MVRPLTLRLRQLLQFMASFGSLLLGRLTGKRSMPIGGLDIMANWSLDPATAVVAIKTCGSSSVTACAQRVVLHDYGNEATRSEHHGKHEKREALHAMLPARSWSRRCLERARQLSFNAADMERRGGSFSAGTGCARKSILRLKCVPR